MIIVGSNGQVTSSEFVHQYSGDKYDNQFRHWKTFGTDPSEFVKLSYGVLSSRLTTLYHTASIVRACVNKPLAYSIGDGLFFKSLPNPQLFKNEKEARKWGRKFTELLHYEKSAVNYYSKQQHIFRGAKITGDDLVFLLREDDSGVPFDIIPAGGDNIDWTKSSDGYTLGIKVDPWCRRTGFWSKTAQKYIPFVVEEDGSLQAIQFMFQELPAQVRGMGCFYSEIAHAKGQDRVQDATIARVEQEAINVGYYQASETDVTSQAEAHARAATRRAGGGVTATSADNSVTELDIGGAANTPNKPFMVLNNKEGLKFTDIKSPGNNYGIFNEWNVKHASMATGIPPEVIMSEYSTSFTAHKGALNDFKKMFMMDRKNFATTVDAPINLEYLKHFARTGQIQVIDTFWTDKKVQQMYLDGAWLGPIPGQINPLQEVNADIKAVDAGLTLRSSVAAKYGNDWWNMIEAWFDETEKFNGLSPEEVAMAIEEYIKDPKNVKAIVSKKYKSSFLGKLLGKKAA